MAITTAQQQLYRRIGEFSFDGGPVAYPFHERLAAENGWTIGYTARAITEYRRFLFLAVVAGRTVCPSDQVDQVWHLHLLYTRSYWDRLCGDTLGIPLHHAPSRGGEDERSKYEDLYRRTLESYRACFESEPPADIWPLPIVRFGEDLHFRRVNSKRCWIVAKPWMRGARA